MAATDRGAGSAQQLSPKLSPKLSPASPDGTFGCRGLPQADLGEGGELPSALTRNTGSGLSASLGLINRWRFSIELFCRVWTTFPLPPCISVRSSLPWGERSTAEHRESGDVAIHSLLPALGILFTVLVGDANLDGLVEQAHTLHDTYSAAKSSNEKFELRDQVGRVVSQLERSKDRQAVEAIALFGEFPELDFYTIRGLVKIGSKAARGEIARVLESSDDVGAGSDEPCRRARVLKYCEKLPKRLSLSLLQQILLGDKHASGVTEALNHLAQRITPKGIDMVFTVLETNSGGAGVDLIEETYPAREIAGILHRGLMARGHGVSQPRDSSFGGGQKSAKKKKTAKNTKKQNRKGAKSARGSANSPTRKLSNKSANAIYDKLFRHAADKNQRHLTRAVALRILGSQRRKEALEVVRSILEKEREHRVLLASATAAAIDLGDPSAGPWFVPVVESLKSSSRRKKFLLDDLLMLLEAIYPLRIQGVEGFVLKMLKSKNLYIRMAAISSLPAIGEEEAVPLLRKHLADNKQWRIQLAAIEACRRMRSAAGVDLLIERVGKQAGRLKVELLMALYGLTGVSMPYSQDDWKSWWDVNRDGYKPPVDMASQEKAAQETYVQFEGKDQSTYFGLNVISERLCFIGDASGSMSAPMAYNGDSVQRIQVMKEELLRLVRTFKKRTYFNVYFFSHAYRRAFKQITRISKRSFNGASKFVTNARAAGGTNLYDPLEEALKDPYVDTIYLLSDGAPSAGKLIDAKKILKAVRKLNRLRRIRIHAISIGRDSALMRKLAKQNSGFYRVIK